MVCMILSLSRCLSLCIHTHVYIHTHRFVILSSRLTFGWSRSSYGCVELNRCFVRNLSCSSSPASIYRHLSVSYMYCFHSQASDTLFRRVWRMPITAPTLTRKPSASTQDVPLSSQNIEIKMLYTHICTLLATNLSRWTWVYITRLPCDRSRCCHFWFKLKSAWTQSRPLIRTSRPAQNTDNDLKALVLKINIVPGNT